MAIFKAGKDKYTNGYNAIYTEDENNGWYTLGFYPSLSSFRDFVDGWKNPGDYIEVINKNIHAFIVVK